jgi:hypothetical protein
MLGRGEELLNFVGSGEEKFASSYPEPERVKSETQYTLADIYDGEEYKGKVEVSYEYDHGDGWDHQITLLGRADLSLRKVMHVPDEYADVCLGGEVSLVSTTDARIR